jgi:uncharacterized protein YegL
VPISSPVVETGTGDVEEKNAKLRAQVPNGLNVTVAVSQPQRIIDLTCPTHKTEIERLDTSGRITLLQENISPARFEVNIAVADPNQPTCITEALPEEKKVELAAPAAVVIGAQPKLDNEKEQPFDFGPQPGMYNPLESAPEAMEVDRAIPTSFKKYALALSMIPKVQLDVDVQAEVSFIVDCSGSMAGGRMRRAKNALQLFLRALPESTKFNIVAFGDNFHTLFPESRAYSTETLAQANDYVNRLDAKLGGTDLLGPLTAVMDRPVQPGWPRQIFLLTDGDVKNKDVVLNYIREHIGEATRIFAFGIGNEVSQALMKGIARFGRGKAEFVESTTSLDAPVMRQVRRALQPVLSKISVDWGTLRSNSRLVEPHFGPIFDGERFDFFSFFEAPADPISGAPLSTRHEIKIKAFAEETAFEFPAIVDLSASDLELSVQRFAAHSEIQDMERSVNRAGLKAKIIELATKYRLASKYTSFVAVHVSKESEATSGHMVHMDVDDAINDAKAGEFEPSLLDSAGEKLEEIGESVGRLLRTSGSFITGKLDALSASRKRHAPEPLVAMQDSRLASSDGLMNDSSDEDWDGEYAIEDAELKSVLEASKREVSATADQLMPASAKNKKGSAGFMESVSSLGTSMMSKMEEFFASEEEALVGSTENSMEPEREAKTFERRRMSSTTSSASKKRKEEKSKDKKFPSSGAVQPDPFAMNAVGGGRGGFQQQAAVPVRPSATNSYASSGPTSSTSFSDLAPLLERGYAAPPAPAPAPAFAAAPPPPPPGQSMERSHSPRSSLQSMDFDQSNLMFFGGAPPKPASAKLSSPSPKTAPAVTGKATTPMDIVIQASASGSFSLDSSFATLIGLSLTQIVEQCPELLKNFTEIWATALAIAVLEARFVDSHEEWSMVQTKARRYINKAISTNKIDITYEKVLDAAKAAI